MKKSNLIPIAILYFIVILYVILQNNPYVTALLIAFLFGYQIVIYRQTINELSNDNETSLTRLELRLAKSRQKQEESYKRFLSLSTSFGSGLLMIDEDGICKLANKEFVEYFGIDMSEKDYKELVEYKGLYKFINQSYLLEKTQRAQINHNDNVYDLISTPLFESNLFKGCLILIHDITMIKNAEKYQKRFTADVSHELRTPLAAIKGFSEILSRGDKIEKNTRDEFVDLIQKESNRMEYILNDLMIISKMDRLDYELEYTKQDISLLVDECVSVMKNQIENKNLKLFLNVESQNINLDKHKISQVVMNLIKNAINYTDQGHIEIKGRISNNKYVLEFIDTGIGIEEKNMERIFKRFYRVDKARSRDSGGSGLGLSICKNVVLKHKGEIFVDSEVGKGTKFTITLPI